MMRRLQLIACHERAQHDCMFTREWAGPSLLTTRHWRQSNHNTTYCNKEIT